MRNLSYHLRGLQYTWMTPGLAYRRTRSDPRNDANSLNTCVIIIWTFGMHPISSGHNFCAYLILSCDIHFFPPTKFLLSATFNCKWLWMGDDVDQTMFVSYLDDGGRSINRPWRDHFINVSRAWLWFVRSLTPSLISTLQLFFTSLRYTCHICPPTQALMEYTPNACCVSPSPIRLPLLLCSGYIGRFVFFLPDSLTLSSRFPI